jgi:hypothetical protein
MGFLVYCDEDSCIIDFEAGGGAKFNIDIDIINPYLEISQPMFTPLQVPLLSGAPKNIPDSSYNQLAKFTSYSGAYITVNVATALSIGNHTLHNVYLYFASNQYNCLPTVSFILT